MLFCRFGGEEFALFAPGHDMARAEPLAERLRQLAADLDIRMEGRVIDVTVSIGLADVATFGADFDALHSAADRALYAAKAGGRNRVVRGAPGTDLADIALRMRESRVPAVGICIAG